MRIWILVIAASAALGCSESGPVKSHAPEPSARISVTIGSLVARDFAAPPDIHIEDAVVVRSAVELHLCETSSLLVSTAWAHVANSSTREGTPVVQDLTQATGARITGEVSPPPGTYCGGFVIFSPADDDVLNMTNVATNDIEGLSLLIRGTRDTESGSEPFVFAYHEPIVVKFELPTLNLNTKSNHAQVLVQAVLTDEIARAAAAGESEDVIDAFARMITIYRPPSHQKGQE